jgi:hypothetical protein
MLGFSGPLIGLAATAVLAVTFTQSAMSDVAGGGRSTATAASQVVASEAKSARLSGPRPNPARAAVTTVELVGLGQATVLLRDESGNVVFRSDPRANVTYLAKDVDLPVVTIKEEAHSPVVQKPVAPTREREESSDNPPRKASPVGCTGALSPLVKSEASRNPSLCLAALEVQHAS